jgi:hypothetical protein
VKKLDKLNEAEAKRFVKIYRRIWRDREFTQMDTGPQWLYLMLLSQNNINLAGLVPISLVRWANLSANTTVEDVQDYIIDLDQRCFVVADFDTGELLVRTVIRNDTLSNQSWTLQIGILRQCLKAESSRIRQVLADEIETCLQLCMFTETNLVDTEAQTYADELRELG